MTQSLQQELAHRLLPELDRHFHRRRDQGSDRPLTFICYLEKHTQSTIWGENPLLFSLAAVVFARLGMLPASRAALYGEVIRAIGETREKNPARRQVLHGVLADLALELYTTKGRTFSLDDLLALLRIIRRRQHENWATEEMARRLIDSGFFEVLSQETYGFRHQTFQEYLAAVGLAYRLTDRDTHVRDEAWQLAWHKHTYSRWVEVLRLMVGVLIQAHGAKGSQTVLRWLRTLIEQRKTTEGDPGNLSLRLALASLTELQGWQEDQMALLEEEIVSTWIDELIHRHPGRMRKLKGLANDVIHLSGYTEQGHKLSFWKD
jgi:predicted NACHT family NTPase